MKINSLVALSLGAIAVLACSNVEPNATQNRVLTAIESEESRPKNLETATLAGGCFWKMDAAYQQVKGIYKVEVGYAGGHTKNPTYDDVNTRTTGHAETVQFQFDPSVISYNQVLDMFWHLHDATVLNREGNDIGDDYRSAVFFHSESQQKAARTMLDSLNKKLVFGRPLVTAIEPFKNYYRAESYHQNYYNLHPNEPYTQNVVRLKVVHFQDLYKGSLKPKS